MAEEEKKKEEEKLELDSAGESLGYISLEQARVLAIQHARDNPGFYGRAYSRLTLVWEVINQEEGEEFYDFKLSFRPAGRFQGQPGVEQLIIGKTGNIELRQILDEPTGVAQPAGRRPRQLLLGALGLVMLGTVAVIAVVAVGGLGRGDNSQPGAAASLPTATPIPATQTPLPAPTDAPAAVPPVDATQTPAPEATPKPTPAPTPITIDTPEPKPAPTVTLALAPTPVIISVTATPEPAATPRPAPTPAARAGPGSLTVNANVQNFTHQDLTLQAGTIVFWTNRDPGPAHRHLGQPL